MANELMEKPVKYEVNGEEVKLSGQMVRNYLTSGNGNVSDQEVTMFIQLCRYQHLNPFLHEAYLVKFGSSPAQIITSKEAFMKRAETNINYDGIEAGCIVERNGDIKYTKGAFTLKTDTIVGAWADVFRKDRDHATHVEIAFDEFNKSQATWKAMPATMIRKSAMVNALREAFPQDLGALYTEDDKNPQESTKSVQQNNRPKENNTKTADALTKKFTKPIKAEVIEEEEHGTDNEQTVNDDTETVESPKAEQAELL